MVNVDLKKYRFLIICALSIASLVIVLGLAKEVCKDDTVDLESVLKAKFAKACSKNNECIGNVILLEGRVIKDSSSILADFLVAEGIKTGSKIPVCFSSPGGDNSAAIDIGNTIAKYKLNTCVADVYNNSNNIEYSGYCNSACPYILMAGEERLSLGKINKIEIHASRMNITLCNVPVYQDDSSDRNDMKVVFKRAMKNYTIINSDREFSERQLDLVDAAFDVPHENQRQLDHKEAMKRYHLLTKIIP